MVPPLLPLQLRTWTQLWLLRISVWAGRSRATLSKFLAAQNSAGMCSQIKSSRMIPRSSQQPCQVEEAEEVGAEGQQEPAEEEAAEVEGLLLRRLVAEQRIPLEAGADVVGVGKFLPIRMLLRK